MKRLVLLVLFIAAVALAGLQAVGTHAAAKDFVIQSIDCSTALGHIKLQKVGTTNAFLGHLVVAVTPAGGSQQTLDLSTLAPPDFDATTVSPDPGVVLDVQAGPGAVTSVHNPITTGDTFAFSATPVLQPGALIQLFDTTTASLPLSTATCPLLGLSRTLTVSTQGVDLLAPGQPNTVCGPDLTSLTAPSPALPGPCLTIQNALLYARDGDTILVESGVYEICSPIELSKLVNISAGSGGTAGNAKVILHSFTGDTVFHVTAIGAPVGPAGISNQAAINGFAIGGAFKPAAAAIMLDNDAFTNVTNNVLGGEPLNNPEFNGAPCVSSPPTPTSKQEVFGNAAGVMLQNSDHPNISNNSILGSAIFQFSPILSIGDVLTGFGIVTSECLGLGSDASDSINIASNLINRNVNAGIWLCSDGGGLHQIKTNTVRNNGRAVVLRGIADTTIDSNIVSDDYQDAIVVYDASLNDTISNNTIESQRTPGSAGIRLGDFGASLFPLNTTVGGNRLVRNWIGIVVAGARATTITGNTITTEDIRTGVLLQVGSTGSPTITQPTGTQLHQNTLVYTGACAAGQGCAIRLDQFVIVNVDATGNNFGLPAETTVDSVLWHRVNDPTLGYINAGQVIQQPTQAGGVPGPGTLGSPTPFPTPFSTAFPTPTPFPTPGESPTPTPFPTPIAGGNPSAALHAAASLTSPALGGGQPGGSTRYSPVCNFVSVPSSVGSSITSAKFLSLFQPATNITSGWRVNNGTHAFDALYFADSSAPVDATLLRPGDVTVVCVAAPVQGPP